MSESLTADLSPLPGQDPHVRRSVLPGGVRLLTERMAHVRSATIGAWLPVGSRDEANGHFGSTHFLEHLLFKGTGRRDAMEIAASFDRVGGEANASTAKEHTCYYARVLDKDLPMALDVLLDMVTSALLDPAEFELERGVILEELAMTEDDPHEMAHEAFAAAVFGSNPLARPIGGTAQTIRDVPRTAVWEHYRTHYRPETLIVAAAGNVDHDELAGLVGQALDRGGWDRGDDAGPRPRRSDCLAQPLPHVGARCEVNRPVEQAQLILGCEGLAAMDPRRHAFGVLTTVLGGGMSSRLFQEIRERRGLAYSTYAFGTGHADTGSFGLFAGCGPGVAEDVVQLLGAQLDLLAAKGIRDEELARAKGQLGGGLVLGMEDSSSRMTRLGRAEIVTGELPTLDEMLVRVDRVRAGEVAALAEDLAARPRHEIRLVPA
ncbi:MAG: insulinase family protein [Bifidobacteriaceae bacterium]|jgi:predicted Zn-dependent peptidase|nr:insulinase family protein [Bifidobacteriaceae bacterium]